MSQKPAFSLLQPSGVKIEYKILPEQVMHDLGLDAFCKEISGDATERRMIANVLSKISSDPAVSDRPHTVIDFFSSVEAHDNICHLAVGKVHDLIV